MNHQPHLDGIRAIAVLLVVLNHVPEHRLGFALGAGVDIFFVLSGWLITTLLIREYAEHGVVSLKGFYVRRIFRIVPLYYFVIALYGAVALYLPGFENRQLLSEFKSVAMKLLLFNSELRDAQLSTMFGHAWSLGIEEKFYVVWPLVLSYALIRPRSVLAIALILGTVTFALVLSLLADNILMLRGYWGLAIGACVAYCAKIYAGKGEVPGVALAAIGLGAGLVVSPHRVLHFEC